MHSSHAFLAKFVLLVLESSKRTRTLQFTEEFKEERTAHPVKNLQVFHGKINRF